VPAGPQCGYRLGPSGDQRDFAQKIQNILFPTTCLEGFDKGAGAHAGKADQGVDFSRPQAAQEFARGRIVAQRDLAQSRRRDHRGTMALEKIAKFLFAAALESQDAAASKLTAKGGSLHAAKPMPVERGIANWLPLAIRLRPRLRLPHGIRQMSAMRWIFHLGRSSPRPVLLRALSTGRSWLLVGGRLCDHRRRRGTPRRNRRGAGLNENFARTILGRAREGCVA